MPTTLNNQPVINDWLAPFSPISLGEMNAVSLMKRVDTKFMVRIESMASILDVLKNYYRILEISKHRLMTYQSLYFDTPDYLFYRMHHNGLNNRIKIRKRLYVESDLSFLEVKIKNLKGSTAKSRVIADDFGENLSDNEANFTTKTTGQKFDLQLSITNQFNRFTLVDKSLQERVTVDLNLQFNNSPFEPKLVVVELKQERLDRKSALFQTLRNHGYSPYSFSKYCIGLARSNQDLKQNLFKPKFRKIHQLSTSCLK